MKGYSHIPRDCSGRYAKYDACEACRRPIRGEYYSDGETLETTSAGLLLCGRKRCIAKREAMPVAERISYYQRTE